MSTPRPANSRLTYDDFLLFPDDGNRHELIDGVHCVTPSPNRSHQELLGRLHLALGGFVKSHRHLGQVLLSPFDVVLSSHDVVEPDLLFIAHDQEGMVTEHNVQGPPALVVEIFSPSTKRRDQTVKRSLFELRGVREYWMVDPDRQLVSVFRRSSDGALTQVEELIRDGGATVALTSPLLPAFSLDVNDLFSGF